MFTWDGAGSGSNWSDSANWAGAKVAIPGAGDDVVFDATGSTNAIVNQAFTISSLTITADYEGTNTQSANLTVLNDCILSNGTWQFVNNNTAALSVDGDMFVNSRVVCQYTSTNGNGLGRTFTIGGNLNLEASGKFDARGLGFIANRGPGVKIGSQGGGGHGGMGGTWNNGAAWGGGGTTYGSVTNPTSLGSGGSVGVGGGAIVLLVGGSATIDGILDADGALMATSSSGTGAGGSILIRASSVSGSGTVLARGGYWTTAPEPPTGTSPFSSGGGGRIAIFADTMALPVANLDASARWSGTYGKAGGAGTIYLQTDASPEGVLVVDGKNTVTAAGAWPKPTTLFGPLVTDLPLGSVLIRDLGDLHITTNITLTVGGWFTNSATFTANDTSTVVFATANPANVAGNFSFYDLSCEAPGKTVTVTADRTLTVRNLLTLKGATGSRLTLRSSAASKWNLTVQNAALTHEVREVDVAWSDASGGAAMPAFNSFDAGNNINWVFAEEGQTNVWTGTVSTNWNNDGNWSLGRLPVPSDVVVIPDTANDPTLDFDKSILSLVIETGGLMRLGGYDLLVTSNLTVNGTLTASGSEQVEVFRDVNMTGGVFNNASTTFFLSGPFAQSVTCGTLAWFNELNLANSNGVVTFTDLARATNLTANATDAEFNGGLQCANAVSISGGSASFGGPVSAVSFTSSYAPLVFGGTFTADILDNFVADMSFGADVSCGTFSSDGANTLTFQSGAAVDLNNLWLNGATNSPMLLRNSASGSYWLLNVAHAAGVSFVDVRDSNASGGMEIEPTFSQDSGHNLNWNFGGSGDWAHWTGATSTDFMNADNWDPSVAPDADSMLLIDGYFTRQPRLLSSATVTVSRLKIGGHQTVVMTNDGALTVSADLTILPNGVITHTANTTSAVYRVNISVGGDLFIAGSIDVDGKGYSNGKGPGGGTYSQAGGGHGGRGGEWQAVNTGGECYGSIIYPELPGSGGANGPGGGAVRLVVNGHIQVDGMIAANGKDLDGSAAGAGGSIWLTTATLSGAGLISADGGRGGTYITYGYAHGGGGRIAVYLDAGEDFGDVEIRAISKRGHLSTNHRGGGAGSVYLRKASETHGVCIYDNNGLINVWRSEITGAVTNCEVGDFIMRGTTTIMFFSNQTLTVHGMWSNAASSFSSTTDGAVEFAGSSESALYGNTAFGGLVCTAPNKILKFEAGRTFSVSGLLELLGIHLRSTSDGVQARLSLSAATGTQMIKKVSVKDNDASGGQTLTAEPRSKDLFNNLNWEFIPAGGILIKMH